MHGVELFLVELSGASGVMVELLVEDKELMSMVRRGESTEACLAYINANW